jgi:predicted RNA-binding Zn-ribbon protein involved in translation (DUF1610 family)
MKSVRKGLRDGDIEKDTYGRLECTACGQSLQSVNDPDEVGTVRRCPECGAEFREL